MDETSSLDVFELLGEETRLAILRALLSARRESADPYLSFTALRDAADVEDTGRFNYHLGKLVGTLVVDDEAGYRLSAFGFRLFAQLSAGLSDPNPETEAVALPGSCPECDDAIRAEADGNAFRLVCDSGHTLNHGMVGHPATIADRPPSDAAEALGLLNTQARELGVAGVCPMCHGHTAGEIERRRDGNWYYSAPCADCGNQFSMSVGDCVLTHPAVVAFFAERGVDVRTELPWTLPFRRPGAETVRSEEPLRVEVTVGAETADPLSLVLDRSGSVVAVDGEPA